ncbi:acetoacetate decarboxylase family protein [Cryptosporangium sp. NPDC051539]|uniref:acetoacetate decarboxylase family protein n=1 Tax=Cryptosporangium sp. NPDC051539 TaxID=3363962 RepID=UPI00378DEEF7
MTTYDVAGRPVTMPVQVRDASAGTVLFDVNAAAAAALIPPEFEIVESAPGRGQLAVALVDYRDNDLGAYHEVGLMFFVRPRSGGEDGTFITRLPVDQSFTCEAGRKIWGFPKSVERIDVENTETSSSWTLYLDGEFAVRVRVPRGGSDEMPPSPMTAYSLIGGVPHRTTFTQGGAGSQVVLGGEGVEVTLGSHVVSAELAALGLPGAPVVLSSWIERMRATFDDARSLKDGA